MQKLYNYTRYFQPSKTYTEEYCPRFIDGLKSLKKELIKNPMGESRFFFKEFRLPYGEDITGHYYDILYAFAKFLGVKMMWREFATLFKGTQRGILIIGEEDRIELLHFILLHYFKAEIGYVLWIRENKRAEAKASQWGHIRVYASKVIDAQRETITIALKKLLVEDTQKEMRLENYILEQYQLNPKEYKCDKVIYYHNITKHYTHKRMLL